MKIPYLHNKSSFETGAIALLKKHPNYIDGNEQFNWVFFFGLFTYTMIVLIGMANVYQYRKYCGDIALPAHSTEEIAITHYKAQLTACLLVFA